MLKAWLPWPELIAVVGCAVIAVSCADAGLGAAERSWGSQTLGARPRYTVFETGQVRPLALSPDGSRLFAVNTPDARLEIFDVKTGGLQLAGSVPVELRTLSGFPGFEAGITCGECHVVVPNFNAEFGVPAPGLFGGSGLYVIGDAGQVFKIPHLRNLYQKVGMVGMVRNPSANPFGSDAFMGDQIRGFGFTHDGAVDTIFRFHGRAGFIEDPWARHCTRPVPADRGELARDVGC